MACSARWARVACEARADVQLTGFGLTSTYHADNEYALLSDMKSGFQVLCRIVGALNSL